MAKTFTERLDDAARLTGVPAIAEGTNRCRHLRWWPVVALVPAVGGFAICATDPEPSRYAAGYVALMVGLALSIWLPIAGPVKPWGRPADERDREVRRDAFLFALGIIAVLAVAGLWIADAAIVMGQWSPERTGGVLQAGAYLLWVLYNALPTLHASWRTRPLGDED